MRLYYFRIVMLTMVLVAKTRLSLLLFALPSSIHTRFLWLLLVADVV
jgi:hypothetical protein